MNRLLRMLAAFSMVLVCFSTAHAHFSMLLPDKHSVKKGEEVKFTNLWGHPFEHQLFDAPVPWNVFVFAPDGKKTEIFLGKVEVPAGDKKIVVGNDFIFKPDQRGDYVFVLQTPPIWMEEEREFLQDTVRVVLHVQAQKGWDTCAQQPNEVVPLTRPYGLQAGMVFQAQVFSTVSDSSSDKGGREADERKVGKPLAKALVEIERYNATPPKELPPDEEITRTAKTDPSGVVTCTLTEPGWWCVAAQVDVGRKKRDDGKEYPVRHRAIHWVYVDYKPAAK